MKITIDTDKSQLTVSDKGSETSFELYSDEAFEVISRYYTKVGWNQKQSYSYSWMGRPIIQLPDDMVRLQEAIYKLQPDVIVETGVAHGGSLIFYASLCKAMGKGRVIGIDIEIRPHNRAAIEQHELFSYIELFEGSSIDEGLVSEVTKSVGDAPSVLVLLDSNHTYDHVAAELQAYSPLVTPSSYIIATDGIMRDVANVPKGNPDWVSDNPANAAEDFVKKNSAFIIEQPSWPFNESTLSKAPTHWPSAWIKRKETP